MEGRRYTNVSTRNRLIGLIGLCVILASLLFLVTKAFLGVNSELDQRNKEINQLKAELAALTDYAKMSPKDVENRKSDLGLCVEPYKPLIRDVAVATVANPPSGIQSDSESWKIWRISYWVAHNISYVSDPKEFDYYALASETMLTRAGDCDDFAILLSSMYESVGLDASIAFIDTNGDRTADHMTCLVHYLGEPGNFLDEEKLILDSLQLKSPTGKGVVANFRADTFSLLPKYNSGIWIIIDPPFALVRDMAGYVTYEEYHALRVIDVGS